MSSETATRLIFRPEAPARADMFDQGPAIKRSTATRCIGCARRPPIWMKPILLARRRVHEFCPLSCVSHALSRSLTDSVTGQPRRRTQRVRIVMLAAPVRRRWPPKSSTHRNSMHRQQCSDKHWRIVPTVRSSWQDQMEKECQQELH